MKMLRTATMVAMIAMPASAPGQTPACGEVDATIQRANAMRQVGRDADAVALLRPLLACGPNPRLRATLGLAELAAALWVQGFQHLSSALGATGDAWVTPRRATLQAALDQARIHVGYLEVSANAPRAELRIGGEMVATLPMSGPMRVAAGTLTYELSADGYVSELRRVEVAGNDALTREHVLMTPRPGEVARPVAAAAVPSAVRPATAARPVAAVELPAADTRRPAGSWMPLTGWLGLVGSAILIGGGAVAYVGAANSATVYDAFDCSTSMRPDCDGVTGRFNTLYPLALTGFIAGGVLAAGSVALLIAAPSSGDGRRRASVLLCGPGPGAVGVSCTTRF